MDQGQRLTIAADLEIVARPFGLGAPIAVRGDFDRADGVGFRACCHGQSLPLHREAVPRAGACHKDRGKALEEGGRAKIGLGSFAHANAMRLCGPDPTAQTHQVGWDRSRETLYVKGYLLYGRHN